MDDTTLEALEYHSVLKELSGFCSTVLGREKALLLRPSHDLLSIGESFSEYVEASALLRDKGRLPLAGASDLRPILSRSVPEGAFYLPEEFILVRDNLHAVIQLKALLAAEFEKRYRRISSRISLLSDSRPLLREIDRVFDDKREIKDDASHALRGIRRDIRQIKERARAVLDEILKDKKTREILQEELVTIRDDRYVLLIKEGKHTEFKGIVHGRSSSGATYFIEPFGLVEINNRLNILKKEEAAEEIAILKALTREVSSRKAELLGDLEGVSILDLIQAKALFGVEIRGVVPGVHEGGPVRLREARHPLLAINEARGGAGVIPVDVMIDEGVSVLVVSGANTGGKTVALKTLGLLTLMASAGLPVPASEGSEVPVFRNVFADIGDRQDIMASLSTFSAHVKRLNEILSSVGPSTLLLIDEIGAGTDPVEGGALALSALETFCERGALTVVTTHLNLLKARAAVDPSYLNASVEFDEGTLKPLYNLRYGVPGPSLGLNIAEGLGIPPEIIERARGHVKEKDAAFVDSIRRLEEEREGLRKAREGLELLEEKRRAGLERLREERDGILGAIRGKAEEVLEQAKREIRETAGRLREEAAKGLSSEAARRAAREVEEIGAQAFARLGPKKTGYVPEPGDRVRITDSNTKGVVLSVDGGSRRAELQVGAMKVWADFSRLEKRGYEKGGKSRPLKAESVLADMEVSEKINIIGMRAEEALKEVSKFLDRAHAAGLDRVEIIHGVGKGVLAKSVAEHLGGCLYVRRSYHGDPLKGGGGVTVVELS